MKPLRADLEVSLRIARDRIVSICLLFADLHNISSQLFGHRRVKPGKLLPHLHMLLPQALDNLEDECLSIPQHPRSFAISMRCTSLVPSPISLTFTLRQ